MSLLVKRAQGMSNTAIHLARYLRFALPSEYLLLWLFAGR